MGLDRRKQRVDQGLKRLGEITLKLDQTKYDLSGLGETTPFLLRVLHKNCLDGKTLGHVASKDSLARIPTEEYHKHSESI